MPTSCFASALVALAIGAPTPSVIPPLSGGIVLAGASDAMSTNKPAPATATPRYDVGDRIEGTPELATAYPGIDLPDAQDGYGYHRTGDFIYCVKRATGRVESRVYVGHVILF